MPTATASLKADFSELIASIKEMPTTTKAEAKRMVASMRRAQRDMTKAAKEQAKDQGKAAKEARKSWDKAFGKIGAAANKAAKAAALAFVAAAAGIGAASAMMGSDFEHAMAKVGAMTGATEEELDQLTAKARDMGKATLFSATEAAGGLEELGKAGMSAQESITALDSALYLAGATGAEIASTAGLLASAIKQFGLEAADTTRISDVYSKAIRTSLLDMDSLSEAMKIAGTAGSSFGMSLEETTAAVAAFRDLGLEGSMAGTNFRMAMISAAKGTNASAAALKKYGLVQADINPETHSFAEIMQVVADNSMSATDAIGIFGTRTGANIARMGTAIRRGTIDLDSFTTALEGAAGETADVYAQILATTQSQVKIVQSAFADLMITLYGTYAEPLSDLLAEIPQLLGTVAEAVEANKAAIGAFASEALGNISEWIREDGPAMAEAFVSATKAAGSMAAMLSKVVPYLDEIATVSIAAFSAAKVYQFTVALQGAITTVRVLGVAGIATLGPFAIALGAIATMAAAAQIAMGKFEKSIIKKEQRWTSSGQERIDMIDSEIAALEKRDRMLSTQGFFQGKQLSDDQMEEMAEISKKLMGLQQERFAQTEQMRFLDEQAAAAAQEVADAEASRAAAAADLDAALAGLRATTAGKTGDDEDAAAATDTVGAAIYSLTEITRAANLAMMGDEERIIAIRDRKLAQIRALGTVSMDRAATEAAMVATEAEAEQRLADLRSQLHAQHMSDLDEEAEHARRLSEAQLSLAMATAEGIAEMASWLSGEQGKYAKEAWAVQSAAAVIAAGLNVAQAISNASTVPPPATPFAMAAAGIQSGVALGGVVAAAAKSFPSAYDGIDLSYSASTGTTHMLPVTTHPGEEYSGGKVRTRSEVEHSRRSSNMVVVQNVVNGQVFDTTVAEEMRRGGFARAETTRIAGRVGRSQAYRST